MVSVEERLSELNILIPRVSKPLAAYVPAVIAGNLVFVSGQLPMVSGELAYTGKVGTELSIEEGQKAARIAIINCLAALLDAIGDWAKLERIIKVTGYIQCDDKFTQQPQVLNGASQLLEEILGDQGRHARVALGIHALPLNAACELDLIAQIKV